MVMVRAVQPNEARVNVTWAGLNGELPDPVMYDATDGDIKQWVTEAIQNGGVPGIPADRNANFRDHIVEKFAATADAPFNRIFLRPKTAFGA